jgi:phosphatidylglycerophosphatase A
MPMAIAIVMLSWAVAASVICVALAPDVCRRLNKKDPGEIVVDEVAGQAVALIPAAFLEGMNICVIATIGFAFFRLFDIVKPQPVKKLEKLPNGWGILADDIMAGIYAAILLTVVSVFKNYLYSAQ